MLFCSIYLDNRFNPTCALTQSCKIIFSKCRLYRGTFCQRLTNDSHQVKFNRTHQDRKDNKRKQQEQQLKASQQSIFITEHHLANNHQNISVQKLDLVRLGKTVKKSKRLHRYPITSYWTDHTDIKPCKKDAFVLLVINSKPNNIFRRNGIRKSWGDGRWQIEYLNHPYAWRTVFVIGRSRDRYINFDIENEAKRYGDIVIGQFIDHFKNLTEKTILGMHWAATYCRPQYYYKGDDDVFVNPIYLFHYLKELHHRSKGISTSSSRPILWAGNVGQNNRLVVRQNTSKYYVSHRDYRPSFYPTYCSGFAYIMSANVLQGMLIAVQYRKKIQSIDDVFIGLLGHQLGLTPTHDYRFNVQHYPRTFRYISIHKLCRLFAIHGITSPIRQMRMLRQIRDHCKY